MYFIFTQSVSPFIALARALKGKIEPEFQRPLDQAAAFNYPFAKKCQAHIRKNSRRAKNRMMIDC